MAPSSKIIPNVCCKVSTIFNIKQHKKKNDVSDQKVIFIQFREIVARVKKNIIQIWPWIYR